MIDDIGDGDVLQFQRGRTGQAEKMFDDVFQTAQFAVNDLQPAAGLAFQFGQCVGEILFEQLDVNVEGTERISDFVGETGEQAREQELFLLSRKLAHILSQRLCQYSFHQKRLWQKRITKSS